ncbi:hypothetical protein Daura_28180 [Dactylosporangium aurantiacum]|uniref:Uncharacterized protein n=1 Tax=Dactylosporangium aurantiacum TaxID=35754 RepID=A0A9Q9MI70_9ACTN|nr:hypothetical protein [Dactylosporangium aurantiacum]MDG6106943.1 hypothetical protein [Dactylosporangium aurantiacum]UWZ50697.1 hypothetical protein Daura_28180 [Dactylosporangium aurantiacum]
MSASGGGPPGLKAAELVAGLRSGAVRDEPAYVTLIRLLTLDGRLPFDTAAGALTARARSVLRLVTGEEALRITDPSRRDTGGVFVALSAQGRLQLLDRPPAGTEVIGRLPLPRALLDRVDEAVADWVLHERAEQRHLDRLLRRWHRAGELTARVEQVADWVERVETVLVYVGEDVFSRSDAGTNTLLRDGVLHRLGTRAPDAWTAPERLFVCAAQVLFAAGRAIRFEEFNGRQLSATGLRGWLVTTWLRYAKALGLDPPDDLPSRCPFRLAQQVGELADAVNRSDSIRFRRIGGPVFAKEERVVELPHRDRSHATTPPAVGRWAARHLGLDVDASLPGERTVRAATAAILTLPPADCERLMPELLEVIVRAAVVDLGADYAMSSAVRDLARLAPGGASRAAGVLELRKPDFFCCVVPHPELRRPAGSELGRMLWLVAQRMQYNRWHFAPGDFDRPEIPRQRHYFFPPALPDLAEHSDLWHGGHVAARVRFSVRAPGASLWRSPLRVRGNDYRGCFDIRAVRMAGEPFVRADLWTAVRYTGLVDAMWRTVAAAVDQGHRVPAITAFDGGWYERRHR